MRILVTGGAGFIGSNFTRMALQDELGLQDLQEVVVLDKLTYAGKLENLRDISSDPRYRFVKGDICDFDLVQSLVNQADIIFNFAAESHVDNSIQSSKEFFLTNVIGVQTLLDAVKLKPSVTFLQISTDEVYGSIESGRWNEESPLLPNSPYAASKAGGEFVARSYQKTYGLDIRITRCANNYGPHQDQEKAIPNFISKILNQENIGIYGDGTNSREWIHVSDHCRAIALVAIRSKPGDVYNIPASTELSNNQLAKIVIDHLGVDESRIKYVQDRKGHDSRYSLDGSQIERDLGFELKIEFAQGISETIDWYVQEFS